MFYLDSRRTWLIKVEKNDPGFHTHAGIISIADSIGKNYGDSLLSTLGAEVRLLRPTPLDFIMKSERRTQIVYPKDFAYIAARSGLRSGSNVLECGTGSGGLTTFFASLVSPTGLIHTFEERADFFEIAKKNVEKSGYSSCVRFENQNLLLDSAVISDHCYDLVLLDTGDPWTLLPKAHLALRGSGFVFCICPTTNQLETVAEAMHGSFEDIECVEIILRRIEARAGKTRPSMRMVGHTCYIASARSIYKGNPS